MVNPPIQTASSPIDRHATRQGANLRFGDVLVSSLRRWSPIDSHDALAEPWRRLLAAALDTATIAFGHLVVLGAIYASGRSPESFPVLWRVVSPIACWLYVVLFWSAGATPGMRLMGILIVNSDGGPVGVRTAIKRTLGFMAASFPAKLGLVPILTDPLRRGWHDSFAGTVVVKSSSGPISLPIAPRSVAPRLRPPNPRAPRYGWPLVLIAYTGAVVVITWPVAANLSTRLAGMPGDNYQFAWNLWFINSALRNGHALLHTNILFHPLSAPLVFDTVDWVNAALSTPMYWKAGTVLTFNLLFLFSLTTSVFSSYWLLASITRHRLASFLCAPIYGLSPFFLGQALGHINIISAEFLPLFTLLLYSATTTLNKRYAVGAAVCLALAGYCDFQFLIFGALVAAAILAATTGIRRSRAENGSVYALKLTLLTFTLGSVLLAPLLVPAAMQIGHASYINKSGAAGAFSADIIDYVTMSPLQTLNHGIRSAPDLTNLQMERLVAPGLFAMTIAGFAYYRKRSSIRIWLVLLVAAFVLSLGPAATINGHSPSAHVATILLGYPGTGFDPPWSTVGMYRYVSTLVSNVADWRALDQPATMPFPVVAQVVPLLGAFRTPARFAIVADLCCAVIAAFGLARLLRTSGRRRHRRIVIAFAAAFLLGLEYLSIPYPTTPEPTSMLYQCLAALPGQFGVVDVPLDASTEYLYLQTLHHRWMYRSLITRCPPATQAFYRQNDLLFYFDRFPHTPRTREDRLALALTQLRQNGAQFIVVHKQHLDAVQLLTVEALLTRLGCHKILDDSEVAAYDTSRPLSKPQPVSVGPFHDSVR